MQVGPPYNIFDLLPKQQHAMHMQFRFGFGKKLILLHGLGASGRYWNEPSKLLAKRFQVVSFDLLGFGESPRPAPFSYAQWQQADALRQALWNEHIWGKVNIVGHSLGALVALEFAKRYPKKVRSLVLSNIPVILSAHDAATIEKRYADIADDIKNELQRKTLKTVRTSKFVKHKVLPRYADKKRKEGVFNNYDLEHLSKYAYTQSIKHSIENQRVLDGLENLNVPTTILRTDKDRAVIKSNIDKLVGAMPNAKIFDTKGTHQFPALEAEKFTSIVKKALS